MNSGEDIIELAPLVSGGPNTVWGTSRPEPIDPPPDSVVVRRVLADETAQFEQLVLRYEEIIYRRLFRMVGSIEEAEDLTQETFVRAYSNLAQYDDHFPFRPWLFRIATSAAIRAQRKAPPSRPR